MIRIKINYDKIDTSSLFQGKNGRMLDLTLMENRDGPDKYGNDSFIVQDLGKERRLKGERGPILGNGKTIGTVQPSRPQSDSGRVYTDMKPLPPVPKQQLDEQVPF